MRLLRTTSTEKSGLFNAFLNQDLEIKPYSQIALGQLSATLDSNELIISNDNNSFTFKCLNAGDNRVVRLLNGSYNNDNSQVLIDDLNNKINNALGVLVTNGAKITIKNASNIGRQGRIIKNSDGKLSIDFFQSLSISRFIDLAKNAYQDPAVLPLVPTVVFTGTSTEANLRMKSSNVTDGTKDLTYKHSTFQNHPIAKGVGVHRIRIANLVGNNGINAGYTIGLTSTDPSTFMTAGSLSRELAITDFIIAISCVDPFNTGGYQVIHDGAVVAGTPAVTPNNMAGGAANIRDVASIEIVGGNIRCVIYQDDGANAPHTRILFSTPYNGEDLWGTYTLHGNSFIPGGGTTANLSLKDIKYTPNPFKEDENDKNQSEHSSYLGAATPGGQNTSDVQASITFETLEVANWFGYRNTSRLNVRGRNISILADNVFQAQIINDAFMLEMINLQLESYDTFQGQRKNILSFIPYDDSNNLSVNYDANNLIFLDLNNKESINLTSLKMRLVRADYSSPDLVGITSAILFIKDRKEA
jgi:hypothetical protein